MTEPTPRDEFSLQVAAEAAGARLDRLLAEVLPGLSRSAVQRLIGNGDVLVNDQVAKASYKVRPADRIEVELPPPAPTQLAPEPIPLDVSYEDADLVVVNKPAGMVVHPGAGVSGGTLANALAAHFNELSGAAGSVRPGLVHRIDKDTSGLLVVAKNDPAHQALAEQFGARAVFKRYVALCHGRVPQGRGVIDAPVGRDPHHRTRMAVRPGGRPALSLYSVRERFGEFTLLDVEIKTGRTHQIRIHLAHLKHPVVGDKVYGGGRLVQSLPIRRAVAALDRHFLHAAELGFAHPRTGQPLRFSAPLPLELEQLLDLIRAGG